MMHNKSSRKAHAMSSRKGRLAGKFCSFVAVALLLGALQACSTDKTAEQYFQDAQGYLRQGKADAAAISLRNALRKSPDLIDARLMLGRLYLDYDDFASAAKELERAWRADVDDPRLLVELVHAHLMAGAPDKAAAVLEDKRVQRFGCIGTALGGFVQLTRGERDKAAEQFEKALAEDAHCTPAFFGLARLALLKNQPKEALRYLDAVSKMPGLEKERSLLRAEALMDDGDIQGAVGVLEKTVDRWPGSGRARLALAWAYLRTGDSEAAGEQLQAIRKRVREQMPSAILLEGVLAYRQKDYQKARDLLRKVEPVMPNNLLLLKLLGGAHAALGEHEQAIGYLTKYVEEVPDDRRALELLLNEQLAVGRVDDALARLDARVRSGEADTALIRALGRLAVASGKYDMLLGHIDQVRRSEKHARNDSLELEALLAAAFLGKGDLESAIAALQRSMELSEDKKQPGLMLLRLYVRQGMYDEAEGLLDRLARSNSEDPLLLNARGMLELKRQRYDQARKWFRMALQRAPEAVVPRLNLARLEILAGNLAAAEKEVETILGKHPKHVGALLYRAQIAKKRGDTVSELRWLERAYEAADRKHDLLGLFLLDRLIQSGDMAKARSLLASLRGRLGKVPVLALAEMKLLAKEGKLQEAVRLGESVIQTLPEAVAIRKYLVRLYAAVREHDKQLEQLKALVALQPEDVRIQARLAEEAFAAGRIDLGRRALAQVRRLGAEPMVLAFLEAELARTEGRLKEAAKGFMQVWQQQPKRKVLLRLLALSDAGVISFPEEQVVQWLDRHPGDRAVRHRLAFHQWEQGRLEAAASSYRALLEQAGNDAVAWNNLALVELERGAEAAALEAARRARSLQPDNAAVLDTYGWVLAQTGQLEEGARVLREASRRTPKSPDILLHLAWVEARLGRNEEARALYSQALELDPELEVKPLARKVAAEL